MKLYRLFYDDTTDLNGEKIEIGKLIQKKISIERNFLLTLVWKIFMKNTI